MVISKNFKLNTKYGNGFTIAITNPMIINSDKLTVELPFKSYGGGYHIKEIGAFTYIGANVSIRFCKKIGRFCSIAPNVLLQNSDHNYSALSTSTFLMMEDVEWQKGYHTYYDDENVKWLKSLKEKSHKTIHDTIEIGNDVWIGNGAKVLKGVHIGNGAVIGAGAVVTKDVEPYTIVAGVPAKVIKKRFSDVIINRLEKIQWWEYGPDILKGLDVLHPESILEELETRIRYFEKYIPIRAEFSNKDNAIYLIENNIKSLVYQL